MHIINMSGSPGKETNIPASGGPVSAELIKEVFCMKHEMQTTGREIISMEEYLCRRQKVRRHEGRELSAAEEEPAWVLAELLHV